MSASFAISMSADELELFGTGDEGWRLLGRVGFTGRTLSAQMAVLRRIAEAHAPAPFPTLLIVPSDQVLVARVDEAAAADVAAVNALLRAQLAGMTPYALDQLRHDWRRLPGGGLVMAAMAMETLEEATGFAERHGFAPVAVTARPDAEGFPGTACFGLPGHDWMPHGAEAFDAPDPDAIRHHPPVDLDPGEEPRLAAWAAGHAPGTAEAAPGVTGLSRAARAAMIQPLDAQGNPVVYAPRRPPRRPVLKALLRPLPLAAAGLAGGVALALILLPEQDVATRSVVDMAAVTGDAASAMAGAGDAADSDIAGSDTTSAEAAEDIADEDYGDADSAGPGTAATEPPAVAAHKTPTLTADAARMHGVPSAWVPDPAAAEAPVDQDLARLQQPGVDALPAADALSLEPATQAASAEPPETLAALPAAGAHFDLDAQGFVRPSAKGTPAPGGYTVFAGAPPVRTAPRPTEAIAAAEAAGAEAQAANAAAEAEYARVSKFRPAARPGDLGERYEREMQGGHTTAEMLAMRPSARDGEAGAAIEARARADAEAQATLQAAADAAARAAAQAEADRQATAAQIAGIRPDARPNRPAAPAAPRAAPIPAIPVQPQIAIAPPIPQKQVPDNRLAGVPRTVPQTSAQQVAKLATDSNEINLNRVNLLGTFGKPGGFRALVRMPGGQVVNVSVGDSIDGGKVVAIGQNELRYVKSGRNLSLQLPKS